MNLGASHRWKLVARVEARYRFRLLATEVTEMVDVNPP
ncbi:hypothetical protein LbDm2_1739 [Levilactobacillus brevis]|uniref:Uncharacterized protein n=1 Tax=Levilactobacillus brevis KB290 TaxID=1001583 RepID=M5AGA0_LEVBR|nr:hypothetical protein LbDm2_1739 [Levilactobacillus brevis]KIO94039.1 hypothetical protein N624_0153 [Levilactobacillus brevis]KIO98982.1 hypothetical protein QP38_1671 [Levilactobacillus brevis]KIO99873.1 hypothetical protein N627_0292 [Levilactobacillus brevis]BAN07869.1 hypothetical protein LVISKB_2234 [Levilactobacillus brevis KB290]